jgi:GTP-dependent phosphoenolpyruvate carboxykinase
MLGNKVELIRYIVTWQETEVEKPQEGCISEEHKNEVEQMLTQKGITFTSVPVDQTGNEWFNGLEFDSYDEAAKVFVTGKEAYLAQMQKQELAENLRLRADIDYIAIMSGVEL